MEDIVLGDDQRVAFDMLKEFNKDSDARVAIVTGYAGTGKTTMIRVLNQEFKNVWVLTPTGKSSLRVIEATGVHAKTIHRFLYSPSVDDKTGKLVFSLKSLEDLMTYEGALVIVDEASMVDYKVWADLLHIAKLVDFKILLMGDLFQLPPVAKDKEDADWSTLKYETKYKHNLTEVHRQALESPVVRASMILRGNRPESAAFALLKPVGFKKMIDTIIELRARGGTTLCHTNRRRHQLNSEIREKLGFEPGSLEPGEPLLVLQNAYDLDRYNGEVVTFDRWSVAPKEELKGIVTDRWTNSSLEMAFGVASVEGRDCLMSPDEIIGRAEENKIGIIAIKKGGEAMYRKQFGITKRNELLPHLHASYGYALTTHKSQGSEWPEVLVAVEDTLRVMGNVERRRWLYTAVTRAKKTCSYVYIPKED